MNYTEEQLAIFEHIQSTNDNLIINAKAGSGKTSTLIKSLAMLRGNTTFQAFNKSIATEINAKANASLSFEQALQVSVSTVHSHGLSAFRKTGRKFQTLSGKVNFMTRDYIKETFDEEDPIHKNSFLVSRLVGYAKAAGFGIKSAGEDFPAIEDLDAWHALIDHYNLEDELTADADLSDIKRAARTVLKASNARLNSIDFDDMIYLPLLLDLKIPSYRNVLLDEAQDINATRRELAFRSIAEGGRIIAVGDPNQAIYGFTGASVDSLHLIQKRAGALELPLSICWRCDADIITAAQKYVPAIRARPDAPSGTVRNITWGSPDSPDFLSLPQPGDAILCRLNRPNVAVCLGLLRRGVRARIEGRDIGKKLISHYERALDDESFPAEVFLRDAIIPIEVYCERESQKLLNKNREAAVSLLEDEVGALQLLIERTLEVDGGTATLENLRALVESLFGDDIPPAHVVTLSSVHKSKGREWPTVYILGRSDYMPFFRATMDWELEQENNLIYVAITRAEKLLVNVHGVAEALDRGLHREVHVS